MNINWQIEDIPNGDRVFYRANKVWIRGMDLKPKAFKEHGEGEEKSMSTNWELYSSAQATRNQATKPEENGVIAFYVGGLRNIGLTVNHAPLVDNRAHTDVKGLRDEDVEIRAKMLDLFSWEITL